MTGTSSRSEPISSRRGSKSSTILLLRIATSKNLTVRSLLLTTIRGSTALWCDRAKFIDVSMTELLIEP